jgi:type IV pilus assembly protein PilX
MRRERGAVLIVSLVFLLMLSMLASSSMQNATLQEKVAGSLRQRNASFQLAEAVLRGAEAQVGAPGFSLPQCTTATTCVPPPEAMTLTGGGSGGASGVNWTATPHGLHGVQYLGQTEALAGSIQGQLRDVYRVTAIGIQGTSRTVLESLHTGERRVMWRQRR